jgi:trimethylamine--corrinoid protein Co-methyltransferase
MKSSKFQVYDEKEIRTIHNASLEILEKTGVRVNLKKLREILSDCGCSVDESEKIVKFPPKVVEDHIKKAPREFILSGPDPEKSWVLNPEAQMFCGLSTAINIYDLETGEYRPATLQDTIDHIIIMDYLEHIVANQMDIWPTDIPMQTITTETIRGWALNATKPYSMGAYGVLPSKDMTEMMAMVMGGRENLKKTHPMLGIVSIQSPLSTAQIQLEGMMVFGEYGLPAILAPEAMAGTTAPVTLAGLLVQHNAEVLSHLVMAQAANPGAPVLYGSVSTVAEMRRGTSALGAVECGMISAGAAQMANFYDIPCRVVAGASESKTMDLQCGVERVRSMLLAALAGGNYITCVGMMESTTGTAQELSVVDNEIIGSVKRVVRGIEVTEESLAKELIQKIGPDGNYLMEDHTQKLFRSEHFMTKLASLEKRDIWLKEGSKEMVDRARERTKTILKKHKPRDVDPELKKELDAFCTEVAERDLDVYYAAEWEG